MSLNAIKALARGVILESVRRKDLWVLAILGVLILLSAGALGLFGIRGLEIFVKDLALTVLGIFSTILAVVTSCRVLPEEIRNRTLYPLLARPITRLDLLVGKFVGAVLVSWIGFVALVVLVVLALFVFGVRPELVLVQYVAAKMMGLALICAVGLCLSTYMTPNAATTLTFVITFGSSMVSRALYMGGSVQEGLRPVLGAVNALVPQIHLFDMRNRVVYVNWDPAPMWVMLALAGYLLAYGGAMVGLSWLRFRKEAL